MFSRCCLLTLLIRTRAQFDTCFVFTGLDSWPDLIVRKSYLKQNKKTNKRNPCHIMKIFQKVSYN